MYYDLKATTLPKGKGFTEHINNLIKTLPDEEAKEQIFKLTYRIGVKELHRYTHLMSVEDALGCMSVAFMKTYNNYDPNREGGSFMNYYKLAIRCEVINEKFRKYRGDEKNRELLFRAENEMEYLDEPVYDKNDRVSGTKASSIPDDFDLEESILAEDMKNDIRKTIDKVFDSVNKYKPITKEIFVDYMEHLMDDNPISYADLGRKYGRATCTVRVNCIKYYELFLKTWKGEK